MCEIEFTECIGILSLTPGSVLPLVASVLDS